VTVRAVVFDIGNVLYEWHPRFLIEKLILDEDELHFVLHEVITPAWHFQHDEGRDFADTSTELIARFPQYEALINAWGPRFLDTIPCAVPGMLDLVRELDVRGVPLFSITNFSHEFFPPFRAEHAEIFDRFQDIVVSGVEKLVKPDPAIYALALRRFGLASGEGIFVDDRLENAEAAGANGFVGHHFTDADALRDALAALRI
jgi:2-haloacid dehalogenase